ncbi:hypothetical protein KCV07_g3183, partial [Aureobasidium melanogenum]
MEPNIALPPRSGPEMVSQKSTSIPASRTSSKVITGDHSRSIRYSSTSSTTHRLASDGASSPASSRTRLDAATADKLLSAVTPADSRIMGLGITFDDTPSPTISTRSTDAGSMRNIKNKARNTEASNTLFAAVKGSTGVAASVRNKRGGVSTVETGPPRWPSGVPGLGNTILGPRCPHISTTTSPPMTSHCNSADHNRDTTFSTYVTSSNDIPLIAPPSRKPSRAIRTSTKRKPTSPPASTGLSAKLAKVSVNSINTQPPIVKREDEHVPKRFGPRRLGPSETEKRAKAAKLWQAEQEKIDRQMERTITRDGVVSDEIGCCVSKQQSVHDGPQVPHLNTVLEDRAGVVNLSPEVQKMIEYACDTTKESTKLSIELGYEHEGSHKDHKTSEIVRQSGRSEGRTTKPYQPRSHKECSQDSRSTANTQRSRHILPSAIKPPSSTSSNDKKRVSFTEPPHLDHLTSQLLDLLGPYTHLHPSCAAVHPLQLIHNSLSSSRSTAGSLFDALKDTQELLKVFSNGQTATLAKLEAMKEGLQKVGMEGVVREAQKRARDTERDVKKLEEWMGQCGCFGDEI